MKKVLVCLLLLLYIEIRSQELQEVISTSPETVAIEKFINTPVNYNNIFTQQHSDLLYTIKTRSGLEVPIYKVNKTTNLP
ncbi:hypothetical protein [uncultured Aquimarina sp.]|uniref:hypothetical protein n=1 Tax=uncultured Aquimarina sp. TaxID=575652 RepID=UPI0026301868|nr:hypothetical protein [uncultured Aquimarina sp.]